MGTQQTDLPSRIAKKHQLLAQNSNRLRDIVEITRRANDHPIAAKPGAGWCSTADTRNVGEGDLIRMFHPLGRDRLPR
jgi:hypothetical protein